MIFCSMPSPAHNRLARWLIAVSLTLAPHFAGAQNASPSAAGEQALRAEAQVIVERMLANEAERGYRMPSAQFAQDCGRNLPVSRFGALADGLARQCAASYATRQQQLQQQWKTLEGLVATLASRAAQDGFGKDQYYAQCKQAVAQALTQASERMRNEALDACKQALDKGAQAVSQVQQKQFDQARQLLEVALQKLTPDANAKLVCTDAGKPLGKDHPRGLEFADHCATTVGNRLTQLRMRATQGGSGASSQCGNLFKAGAPDAAAVSCLVRWFMSNPACKGDKCRAELYVGDKKLWIHPPVLAEDVVLVPDSGYLMRLANKVEVNVSVHRPKKLDMQLRFITEGGQLKDIIATSIKREETAAAVGLQIGETVVVVGASFIPVPGVGDTAGALMPIIDTIASHYMSEHFEKKHQAAIESDDAKAATAAASALAAVYNTLYRNAPGRSNFVSHVCFEAGSSDGKFTGFLNGKRDVPRLAVERHCRDHERWEVWSANRKDGTLVDGDAIYLRSYTGDWLSANAGGPGVVGLYRGSFPTTGAASGLLWRVVSGDRMRIIDNIGVGNGLVSRVTTTIGNDECQFPLRKNTCMVPVRLQSALNGKWLDAGPDNLHAGGVLGIFTKTRAELVGQPPAGPGNDTPWAGYFAVHRWFGSGACSQGKGMRDLNCPVGKSAANETYTAGY